ncbi:hypothetical protein H632_c1044p0 [Helicosporidium sp. ATCC 50920]|nr:hypothetical protein H632_c1044p0 [Helicosporidium sp. ATCC 50920]|eukprot:KDD74834.1 hypothetical protein H632_c1044p0 [Helicosporidium sp. ATCC 50920]
MHCNNAGGVGSVSAGGRVWSDNGKSGQYGICGDPYNSDRQTEAGGRQYRAGQVAATLVAGSDIDIELFIATNHQGAVMFRICDVGGFTDAATEKSRLTEECLDQVVLQRSDGEGPWGYLPRGPSSMPWSMKYRIPSNLRCTHCVLHWYWVTGNSCKPPGVPDWALGDPMLRECGKGPYPEEFWNCADVAIVGPSDPVPAPTPTKVPCLLNNVKRISPLHARHCSPQPLNSSDAVAWLVMSQSAFFPVSNLLSL